MIEACHEKVVREHTKKKGCFAIEGRSPSNVCIYTFVAVVTFTLTISDILT